MKMTMNKNGSITYEGNPKELKKFEILMSNSDCIIDADSDDSKKKNNNDDNDDTEADDKALDSFMKGYVRGLNKESDK